MATNYSRELSAKDIQDTQPVLTRAWNFNTQFDKIFNDEGSRRDIELRARPSKQPYRRVK